MAEQEAPDTPVLLVMVVTSDAMLDDLVTAMLDFGVGGTLVDSKGLAAHLREEMPIFSGLASMLPKTTGGRMVFCVCKRSQANQVMDHLETEYKSAQRPVAALVPIARTAGWRH